MTLTRPSTQVNIAGEISDNARVETLIGCNITHLHDNQEKTVSCAELSSIIKEKYKQCNTLPDMLGGPTLTLKEGCYVNLALIKSDEQIAKEQSLKKQQSKSDSESTKNNTQRDNRLSSFEDIHRPKDPLPLSELFVTKSDKNTETTAHKPIQRVLMLGRAGIGKSTLCQYLAYRWADDNKTDDETWLEEYDVLLWIKLRELLTHYQAYEKNHEHFGLVDAVTKSCVSNLYSGNNKTIPNTINELIHDSTKKILWVLDGFDEVAHLYGNPQHPLYSVLHELFPKAATPAPLHQVLLTSRPYATQGLQVDRTIENIGLLDDDIPRYVTQYFNKLSNPYSDLGKKVITQIKTNPNIHGMAHVPINAYLLCHLYQKESNLQQEETSLKSFTLTQLYQHLIVGLCKRMVKQPRHSENLSNEQQEERLEDYPEDIIERYRDSLWVLAHLAFQGLTDNKAGLTLDWPLQQHVLRSLRMKIVDYKKNLLPLGLLKTICETSEDTTKAPRYFMHLTFQEFFAALYLVWSLAQYGKATQQDKDRALNFLKNNKYTPRYQVIFWFAAGLVRDATWFNNDDTIQQTALTNLWEKGFLSEPQDITGLGQFHLLAHTFEEGGVPDTSLPPAEDNPINSAWTFIKNAIDKVLISKINNTENSFLWENLFATLTLCPHLSNDHTQTLVKCLEDDDVVIRLSALQILSQLNTTNPITHHQIAESLSDDYRGIRLSALDTLAHLNVTDTNIIQLIAECLTDKYGSVRLSAINALAKLNASSNEIHQQIAKCLSDNYGCIRKSSINTLAQLNTTDPNIHQQIAKWLTDDDWDVCQSVIDALVQLNVSNSVHLQIAEYLQHDNRGSCEIVIKALTSLNVTDNNIHLQIAEYLQHDNKGVRLSTINALVQLNASNSVYLQIAERLADKDKYIRLSALDTLAHLNVTDTNILQLIAERLDDEDPDVRKSAIKALAQLNVTDSHSLQLIAERLVDNVSGVRLSALDTLAHLNVTDTNILQLIAERLADKEKYVCQKAINTLAHLNVTDTNILQLIAERLDDDNWRVRSSAINALAQLNATDSHSLQLIAERLVDDDSLVRSSAINALAQLNVTDTLIPQHFAERLSDDNWRTRQKAINTLAHLNVTDTNILQLIAERLDDDNWRVRSSAINALAQLNATDSHSLQLIAERLVDDNWRVRDSAINALAQLNATDSHSLQLIAERLVDDDSLVRSSAINALAQLNATDSHSLQLIAERLVDDDSLVRSSAINALAQLNGTDAHIIIQLIAERLVNNDQNVRDSAINALAQLNGTNTQSIQLIAQYLHHNNMDVRKCAIDALAKLNVNDTNILQYIAEHLTDDKWLVRQSATKALAELSFSNPKILQQIAQNLHHNNMDVRQSAMEALYCLQPNLTIESWLSIWDKRLPDKNKRVLSITTVHRIMTTWIENHLSAKTNSHLGLNPSPLKISRLFAKWIFDWLQLPLVIDEKQHTLTITTAELTDTLSIEFPNHPLGQTAFKRCKQALALEALIHPIVAFPGYTRLHTHHLKPENRFNDLCQHLVHHFNTNEGFDFDYVLHNILHTYAALFEQKYNLKQKIIDLVLKHPANHLSQNPILHHFNKTTPIQTLLEKDNKNMYGCTPKNDEHYTKVQLDKTIRQYEQATLIAQNDSPPYRKLACLYHIKAQITPNEAHLYCKLAKYSFNQALKQKPTSRRYTEYGQFLYIQQRYKKALPLLTQAIKTTRNATRTNLSYDLLKLSTLDTTLQNWAQSHKIIEIHSTHLAYYLKYRCYEALEQTQQKTAWLRQWAEWLASAPHESFGFYGKPNDGYSVSQYLLTTCQNEHSTTAIQPSGHSDTTETNDESPIPPQIQPLENQQSTTAQPALQRTPETSSAEAVIHEHWQHIMATSLGHPAGSFNLHLLPSTPLPSPAPASRPSHESTSDNDENTIHDADTPSSSL